jgi:hypothetical protein
MVIILVILFFTKSTTAIKQNKAQNVTSVSVKISSAKSSSDEQESSSISQSEIENSSTSSSSSPASTYSELKEAWLKTHQPGADEKGNYIYPTCGSDYKVYPGATTGGSYGLGWDDYGQEIFWVGTNGGRYTYWRIFSDYQQDMMFRGYSDDYIDAVSDDELREFAREQTTLGDYK